MVLAQLRVSQSQAKGDNHDIAKDTRQDVKHSVSERNLRCMFVSCSHRVSSNVHDMCENILPCSQMGCACQEHSLSSKRVNIGQAPKRVSLNGRDFIAILLPLANGLW